MTITHRIRAGGVSAWRLEKLAIPPPWVTRQFHSPAPGRLCAREGSGCIEVTEGQWVVCIGGIVIVMHDREFSRVFEPAPRKP